jgi:hypothetical protein
LNFTKQAKVYSSEWAVYLDDGEHPSDLEEYVQLSPLSCPPMAYFDFK